MNEHWEILDLYKALMAVAAGLILGLERELKDKAAGLKTITIITLGATLFSIISYKASPNNSTQIAAYIVSGVGFLGAGVIFKDGFTVSGLTTAGIIWIAAAIGTSIGFGEFYMAATFLVACLLIIAVTPLINSIFVGKKHLRTLEFVIDKTHTAHKKAILDTIAGQGIRLEEKKIELKDGRIFIGAEVTLRQGHLDWLETYLLNNAYIVSFTL